MIPRVAKMAAEVAAQFTTTQLEDYGNIILNGYATTGPNSTGKLAWQYQETTTAPAALPSVTSIQPLLRGWTTNYQEYYTQLQPNGYGVNPGDPTMFEYTVHSFVPGQAAVSGIIATTGSLVGGSLYNSGTYTVPLTGGTGGGAVGSVTVGSGGGAATAVTITNPGGDYPFGLGSVSNAVTRTITGSGTGLRVDYNYLNGNLTVINAITIGGSGYAVGDTAYVGTVETGIITISTVTPSGAVTGFTLVTSGSNYTVGDVLTGFLPGGSGWSITVVSVTSTPEVPGGQPFWAQTPRRFFQNQVGITGPNPSINYPNAIQYSFVYPVSDNPVAPPIDVL